jgi:hypothetical protein
MGTRAHPATIHSAITTPAKRSALDPPGRPTGDSTPLPALNHNDLEV